MVKVKRRRWQDLLFGHGLAFHRRARDYDEVESTAEPQAQKVLHLNFEDLILYVSKNNEL